MQSGWATTRYFCALKTYCATFLQEEFTPQCSFYRSKHLTWYLDKRYITITDSQVRLQTDNFLLFLCLTNGQMTNFHLHDEQLVHGLRNITCASFFSLKRQYIFKYLVPFTIYSTHIYIYIYWNAGIYIHRENETNGIGNFCLFAATGGQVTFKK